MSSTPPYGKILIVDDDKNITDLLRFNLTSEGFGVSVVPVAKDVVLSSLGEYRMIIIDALGQKYSGLDLCTELKANDAYASIPVIVCSERESEDVIIDAFDAGAEDFIAKPFSLREMIARIKAILRRHPMKAPTADSGTPAISFPMMRLTIEPSHQKVTVSDSVVPLTKTEYSILLFLVQNRNSFFTRGDICQEVWKEDASSNIRIVDTNISRLRKKLGESGKYIINRYGMGYAFVDKIAQ